MHSQSRRQFLKLIFLAASAAGVAGCASRVAATPVTDLVSGSPPPAPDPSLVLEPPTPAPTSIPAAPVVSPTVTSASEVDAAMAVRPTMTLGISAKRLVGYLPSWTIGRDYSVADVPLKSLTHLIYAFAKVTESGECGSANPKIDPDAIAELRRRRATAKDLRTSISVGGDGGAARFPIAAASIDSRKRFAASAVSFMKHNGFDGIDLDWEYPNGSSQKHDFTAMVEELRTQLDDAGRIDSKRYGLTIAAPAGPAHYANLELDRLAGLVDWFNLMTYAFHGTWSSTTNFNAPLFPSSTDPSLSFQRIIYNTDAAVQAYLGAGVPADKIVVGVPFYAYGWKGVPDVNHGLYQSSTGLPPGTRAPGVFTYRDLKSHYLGTFSRYWHDEAQVPWLYDPKGGVMITYDDPASVGVKADYVRTRGLGGVMAWELSSDDGDHSLVTAIHDHLHQDDPA